MLTFAIDFLSLYFKVLIEKCMIIPVRAQFRRQGDPEAPHHDSHGREAVHMPRLRQVLHPDHANEGAYVPPHGGVRLQVQVLRSDLQQEAQVCIVFLV